MPSITGSVMSRQCLTNPCTATRTARCIHSGDRSCSRHFYYQFFLPTFPRGVKCCRVRLLFYCYVTVHHCHSYLVPAGGNKQNGMHSSTDGGLNRRIIDQGTEEGRVDAVGGGSWGVACEVMGHHMNHLQSPAAVKE